MAAKTKVLLVLGDPGFAASMAKYLGSRNFEPIIARDASNALDTLGEIKPDCAIVSQLMSPMDGVTLVRRLKESRVALPVALVAAVSSPQGISDVRRSCEADTVLPSTFQPEALVATIRRLTTPAELLAKPAPRPRAHAEIEAKLKNAPKIDAAPAPVEPAQEKIATSVAPTAPIEPAWLLCRAYADTVTGALRFVSGGIERTVYFAQGRPIVVTSNVPEERIGQILIRKGKITPRELDTALNQVKKKNKRLASVIVEMGIMTQREQDEEVADQYAERTLALFGWHESSVEFTPRAPPDELVPIRLAPERIVIEGLRRHYDVARLEAVFPNPLAPMHLAPEASQKLALLNLSPLEGAVLVLVDGQRSVAELASLAPSRLDALRALYAAACLGILN